MKSGKKPAVSATELHATAKAVAWLRQFKPLDRDPAIRLLRSLTLISHTEFERGLLEIIVKKSEEIIGPVALYATREQEPTEEYFKGRDSDAEIDAVSRGNDLGSEARVAAIIRNLAKGSPQKFMNHPNLKTMREKKCRAIFVVDDFIGSGERTSEFLASFWLSKTLRSWKSLKLIDFYAMTYSATTHGIKRVSEAQCRPKVIVYRACPTFHEMPWQDEIKDQVTSICRIYGRKTSYPDAAFGFDDTMATIVFEHGCPDNAPSILWAPKSKTWDPIFPQRTVLPQEASSFPAGIEALSQPQMLSDAGQEKLAEVSAIEQRTPFTLQIMSVLGLAASGVTSRAAIAYATGTSVTECGDLLDECIKRGFLTSMLRLTASGRTEIKSVIGSSAPEKKVPPEGENGYYPRQLRGS